MNEGMIASVRRLVAVVLACLVFTGVRCVTLQATGGTGDETVIGMIVCEDGSPAGSTEVTLRPYDFDPASGKKPSDYGADTTDSEGRYTITLKSPKAQRYVLQAFNVSQRTKTIIPDIDISEPGESFRMPAAALHKTGNIKVILSDSSITGNGHVFIPGTTLFSYMEDGYAIIDSVPAETISRVCYNDNNAIGKPQNLAEHVEVKQGISAIVAFSGSAHAGKIHLNTTPEGADVVENVFNFPLLIRLSSENFDFSEARTDGSDLRFTIPDNSTLPFEIERWDAAAKQAEIWVKVDTVYGNDSSHFLVMYWGEPATAIALDNANVFDSAGGFRGVWHLAEEAAGVGTKGLYIDAVGRNNGDDFISATGRSGIIGYGHAFDGIDDFIPVNGPVTGFLKADVTIALWVSIHDSGGTILSKLDTSPNWSKGESSFYFGDGTDAHVITGGIPGRPSNGARPSFVGYSDDYAIAGQSVGPDDWHCLVYTWKWNGDSTGTSRYYIDGMEVPLSRDSLAIRSDENVNALLRIGQPNNNESFAYFKGHMDELQISAVARSADWVKLSYMNQRRENVLVKY
jgi:hypothetical protein